MYFTRSCGQRNRGIFGLLFLVFVWAVWSGSVSGFFALEGCRQGLASQAASQQPDLPYIRRRRRSGCVPAEPYPPLRHSQGAADLLQHAIANAQPVSLKAM